MILGIICMTSHLIFWVVEGGVAPPQHGLFLRSTTAVGTDELFISTLLTRV
jgi:hypothetical protein